MPPTDKPTPADDTADGPADKAHTLEQISAPRRQFFRQILALGVEGVEHAGRRLGQRLGDAVEKTRAEDPPTASQGDGDAVPPSPPVQVRKPDGSVGRES